MRSTSHDESILEFTISSGIGLRMVGAMDKYVGILTGVAQRSQKQHDLKEFAILKHEDEEKRKRFEEFKAKEREIEMQQKRAREDRKIIFDEKIRNALDE
jgi:3-deoxy-D-manno-octulosonate 8-phosphate phosphatase KdsC-like HAD superfamily phosphatase